MKKGDVIILSDGNKATVIFGNESDYQYSCIVKLENGQLKVVEEKNLSFSNS
ncbi:hypothetical protein KF134_0102 [Lactococcus lactis subsp. lactis]|uniref:hypothetical protein n=1 Tax=Lactococcus lactis TaxID=1358 RepID=UPI00071E4426|nr:hypothetical protein [Lactococcus lactis]KST92910.1 hypothetical protein KF134_0102 [Lactococcus lactis subsp. lactis]